MTSPAASPAARQLAWKLGLLLTLRRTLAWGAAWLLAWGVIALVLRVVWGLPAPALAWGLAGLLPILLAAALIEHRRRPAPARLAAALDRANGCGGLLMAATDTDIASWRETLPTLALPALSWNGGRQLGLFGLALGFALVVLALPDRFTALGGHRPLETTQQIEDLMAQISILEEEKVLDPEKAEALKEQLNKLGEESSGLDPAKTWEAMDHLKETASSLADQTAETTAAQLDSLAQAENTATALELAQGLASDAVLAKTAQELAAQIEAAQLDKLGQGIPQDLLAAAKAGQLSSEQLQELLKALKQCQSGLGQRAGKLGQLKFIDGKCLSKCQGSRPCLNTNALYAMLKEGACESLCENPGRGGIDRGRGDAAMTWSEGSSENDTGFKEQALPTAFRPEDAQLVGLTQSAPEVAPADAGPGPGALQPGSGSGGAARAQVVLPQHQGAVQRFFKREGKGP